MGQDAEIEIPPVAVAQKLNAPPGTAAVTYGVSAPPGSTPVVAVPAGNFQSTIPMQQQEKQGGTCCGCCDFRRAVIIVAIISLIPSAILIFVTSSVFSRTSSVFSTDDDGVILYLLMAVSIFNALTSIAALIGALKFNANLVALNVVGYLGKYWSGHYLTTWGRGMNLLSFIFVTVTFVGIIVVFSTLDVL